MKLISDFSVASCIFDCGQVGGLWTPEAPQGGMEHSIHHHYIFMVLINKYENAPNPQGNSTAIQNIMALFW